MITVVVADPPWMFVDKLPGRTRGAEKQYECMPTRVIQNMLLPFSRAPRSGSNDSNAVLFLWRVASMQQEALDVARSWGFAVKSEIVWEKLSKTGNKPHFGMGRYVRMSHETCLIGARGKAFPACKSVTSRFRAPIREHSRKPDEFFLLVERMYPPGPDSRYVELFARERRSGWEQYGNELEKFS